MSNLEKVIRRLNELCEMYKKMPEKKFQLKAMQGAVKNLKKFEDGGAGSGAGGGASSGAGSSGIDISSGADATKKVKGIGKGIIRRIDEILDTDDLAELKALRSSVSSSAGGVAKRAKVGEKDIIYVTGIGPVAAKKLEAKGYVDIDGLRGGFASGDVKLTHHQKLGVKYYEDFLLRIPRSEIVAMEKILKKTLVAISGGGGVVGKKKKSREYILEVCGSYRRRREDCGDIDVLITYKGMKDVNADFMKLYVKYLVDSGFIIDHLTVNIKTKYMGICKLKEGSPARRIDIRAVPYHCFYPALIYFTGSKEFNIEIRRKALEMGYSLSEYGFKKVDDDSLMSFNSEVDIFKFLGLDFVDPVDR